MWSEAEESQLGASARRFESDAVAGRSRDDAVAFAPAPALAAERATFSLLASSAVQQLQEPQARKRIFSGGCTIRTTSFAAGILEVSGIARKYNGWVDSSSDNNITIRVPAENFREAFDAILFGRDVVDKFEEANDVTDQYSDLTTRLAALNSTRQRLGNLLAAETDTERKVPILREIRRIDDQIERIRANLEHLSRAIAYSTITVTFIPYSHEMPHNTRTVFRWVDSLDPFSVTIPNVFRRVIVSLPEEFAVLRTRRIRYFHAEAADGTIFRIGTVRNNPEGDSSFWRRTVIHNIGARFSGYTEAEAGDVKYVLFTPKAGMDYRYLVGTVIKRKLIYVIEVYFPDSSSYERWKDSINESLGELRIR